ncbi:MAG TPA: hypothetical protein VNJ52_04965 [Patescibacteria group bacterium]|nr:hypothetical protein [Patescibacteria group bacterium]
MQEDARANLKTKGGSTIRGIVKRMLHNPHLRQIGLALAFTLGFRGINRVQSAHFKYLRDYHGEKLRRKEIVLKSDDGLSRVYLKPRLSFNYNSRVNVGAKLAAYLLSGSNLGSLTSPAVPLYIALSTSTLTPAATDTTLSGETSVAGLGRALGTAQNYVAPSSLDGGASFDIYKSFTLTGTATTVVSTALFDAASSGNMFAEVNFATSAGMSTNDILQVTWTVNF